MRASLFGLVLLYASCFASACTEDPAPSLRGTPCGSDAVCGALHCVADAETDAEDLEPQPLLCDDLRDGAEPHVACEQKSDCAHRLCLLAGACARPCEEQADCDETERCQQVFARHGDEAFTALSACVRTVDAPQDVRVARELREDALEDGTVEVAIAAVERDDTTLVVLEHGMPMWPYTTFCRPPLCVTELMAGSQSLFKADTCDSGERALVPVASGDHIDPVVLRFDADAAELGADDGFTAILKSEAEGDLQLTRLASQGQRRQLDLNLFYVGARDLVPTGDRGPLLIEQALENLDAIFAQADIFIGEVRQIHVGGMLPERGVAFSNGDQSQGFASLAVRRGLYVELPYLFRLSAGASNSAVNIFFVADIQARTNDGDPEAEAGGIPGPLGMHGTGGSGIVVAADMMAGNPNALGRTLAHELGHYLGLFHTSEADGCVRDVLADTPECIAEDDADRDGLDIADCAEHGADNLMFWAKTNATTLTPDQIRVLRSALILQ